MENENRDAKHESRSDVWANVGMQAVSGTYAHARHPIQEERQAGYRVTCVCGGKVVLYAHELGMCTVCRRDWMVTRMNGQTRLRPIVDHRRDLT